MHKTPTVYCLSVTQFESHKTYIHRYIYNELKQQLLIPRQFNVAIANPANGKRLENHPTKWLIFQLGSLVWACLKWGIQNVDGLSQIQVAILWIYHDIPPFWTNPVFMVHHILVVKPFSQKTIASVVLTPILDSRQTHKSYCCLHIQLFSVIACWKIYHAAPCFSH